MKEFVSNEGGRYTYADDILNLQELALAFNYIFDGCGNFVVSGCNVDGGSIGAGVVYLNGKLRKFNGASEITKWPQYLCEDNRVEQLEYKSGGQKIGRNSWGCVLKASLPTAIDPMTNAVPQHIAVTSTGAVQMKDAWLGRYSVRLDAGGKLQRVAGSLEADGDIKTKKVDLSQNGVKSCALISADSLLFQLTPKNSTDTYELCLGKSCDGVALYKNGSKLAGFSPSSTIIKGDLVVDKKISVGSLSVAGSDISSSARQVNIAPAIAEGGTLLSEKYATKDELAEKIGSVDVYSKSESDDKFLKRAELLKDAVKNPGDQATVRTVIDAQQTLKDTGWLDVEGPYLQVRQYGKLVICQGFLFATGASSRSTWVLPKVIDPPTCQTTVWTTNTRGDWTRVDILQGSRELRTPIAVYPSDSYPLTLIYFTD